MLETTNVTNYRCRLLLLSLRYQQLTRKYKSVKRLHILLKLHKTKTTVGKSANTVQTLHLGYCWTRLRTWSNTRHSSSLCRTTKVPEWKHWINTKYIFSVLKKESNLNTFVSGWKRHALDVGDLGKVSGYLQGVRSVGDMLLHEIFLPG